VTTLLNAKWSSTPILLEAAELLGRERPELFWETIQWMTEEKENLNKWTDK